MYKFYCYNLQKIVVINNTHNIHTVTRTIYYFYILQKYCYIASCTEILKTKRKTKTKRYSYHSLRFIIIKKYNKNSINHKCLNRCNKYIHFYLYTIPMLTFLFNKIFIYLKTKRKSSYFLSHFFLIINKKIHGTDVICHIYYNIF